jgi:hypothetical protein
MYRFLLVPDSATQLATLECLTAIINNCWPRYALLFTCFDSFRIPAHKENLFQTLIEAFNVAINTKTQREVQTKIHQVLTLLQTAIPEPYAPLQQWQNLNLVYTM